MNNYIPKMILDFYDKKDEAEFIQLIGLNDEEKDPLSLLNNKVSKVNEKIEIKRDNAKYLLFTNVGFFRVFLRKR